MAFKLGAYAKGNKEKLLFENGNKEVGNVTEDTSIYYMCMCVYIYDVKKMALN